MSEPLFLDQLPELDRSFRKEAGFASRLSENIDMWPQELTSELYKQLPYLSDYEVNVNLAKVDPQRGFAFGYADCSNKTERPEVEHQEAGLPHIRIPLVVEDRAVKPFSVFLDGEKVMPLTEDRVREILFNPGTFDLSTSTPRDPSLVEPLMPPQRSGVGQGGEYKQASVEERFLAEMQKTSGIVQNKVNQVAEGAAKHVVGKYGKQLAGTAAGVTALSAGAGYAGAKAGSKQKTAAMVQTVTKHYGDGGLQEIVDEWMSQLDCMKDPKQKEAMVKEAFNHISKPQWDAIYKSDKVQKAVQKNGTVSHPEVTNAVYETAAKVYGFHPKVYTKPPEMKAIEQKSKDIAKSTEKKPVSAKTKTANMACGPGILGSNWIDQFKHSPLFGRAVALEEQMISNEAENMRNRSKDQKRWAKMDEIHLQRRLLELELAKTMGAGTPVEKKASLLVAIAPTIREKDRAAFIDKVASDPTLRAGFARSGIGKTLIQVMDQEKYASTDEMMKNLADRIQPTAVTIQKLPGGDFLFKTANTGAFSPQSAQGEVLPGDQAADAIGQEQAMAMQPGQVATAVAEPVEEQPLYTTNEKVVDEFGEWLVQDAMGNQIMGWVFPQMLSWDGEFTPQPIALFTNGSAYAVQDTIAGRLVGKGTTLPVDEPRGDGVFYSTEGGGAACTAPITIGSSAAGPDGNQILMGQDLFGNQIQVHIAEGMARPTRVSDVEYALPASWKFMRLNGQTQLMTDPVAMNQATKHAAAKNGVTLFFNGAFNFEGGCGLSKLARDFRQDLDPVTTEFMLGVLGVEGHKAKQKMAEARKKGSVKLAGLKTITLLSERYAEATKTASALIMKMPNLRRDLTKEAAAMNDEATVDNLLALNFINPENLGIFVSYMGELEQTSEKLAEMLLSSYLGMKELPEGAIERGMKNLEEVITALKAVQHAEA